MVHCVHERLRVHVRKSTLMHIMCSYQEQCISKIGEWTERKKEIMKPFHIGVAHNRLKEYYFEKWL